MVRFALITVLACVLSCAKKGDTRDELSREDIAELRKEVRDLREEQRALRGELRDLRESSGSKLAEGPDTASGPDSPPSVDDENDAGPAAKARPEVKSKPAGQETVKISISSNPTGARVYVEGKVMGRTPVLLERAPGGEEMNIRVEKEGFRARLLTVRPEEDTKMSVQLAKK